MRNRLRKAWPAVTARAGRLTRWLVDEIGRDECLLVAGLALVIAGLWQAWRPGAYLMPGIVLLWIAVPSRTAFISRAPALSPKKPKRREYNAGS